MPDGYAVVRGDELDPVESEKSRTPNVDLGGSLGCEAMRPKLWFVEPGNDRKNFHTHAEQEELYYVVSGTGRMRVADDTLTLPAGSAVRVPPATPRKPFNDTDEEQVWLVVGAPAVDDPGVAHDE